MKFLKEEYGDNFIDTLLYWDYHDYQRHSARDRLKDASENETTLQQQPVVRWRTYGMVPWLRSHYKFYEQNLKSEASMTNSI